MERDRRKDAETARDRCLDAIVGADEQTQRSLWRAALRYHSRMGAAPAGEVGERRFMPGKGLEITCGREG